MEKSRVNSLTPTALAFVGDAVQALYIRRRLVELTDSVCGTLHVEATKYVSAASQAECYDRLTSGGVFTAEEADVARRAKNAHLNAHGKDLSDYHKATALEAVIGWLDASGDRARRDELLDMCFDIVNSKTDNNHKG